MSYKSTYLILKPFFPSFTSYVGNYIFDQAVEIKAQSGFNVEIVKVVPFFSLEKSYRLIYPFNKKLTDNFFDVRIFRIIDIPFFIFPGIFNRFNRWRFRRFLNRRSFIRNKWFLEDDFMDTSFKQHSSAIENVKIQHAHLIYPSAYLVQDLHVKKICQNHGLDVLHLLNGRINFLRRIQRKYLINRFISCVNKMDLNIGVSQLVLDKFKQYSRYHPNQEYVLYNGVDVNKFFHINKTDLSSNHVFSVGCVANFWEIKDQITLIKAIHSMIKDRCKINLRLIGSGKTKQRCVDYVSSNKFTNFIRFENEYSHNKMNIFFNEIDLFVLPSYYEAFGCVYLESWATNTPFIAIKDQGISEIIPQDHQERLLAKKSDVLDLRDKIYYFYNSHSRNIDFDPRYTIQNLISRFLDHPVFNDK